MTKPIDSPYIAWFDLETTGNREDDAIIQVGLVISDRDLNEVCARSWTVWPLRWDYLRERMAPVVVEMHTANGLLDKVKYGDDPAKVDADLAEVLRYYGRGNHLPFAGSGVSHFDRKYIRRELPMTDSLLSYWALDIGVMRRWLQWWGIETPGSELQQAKTHLALDDVREHIAEAKTIRNVLTDNQNLAGRYEDLCE